MSNKENNIATPNTTETTDATANAASKKRAAKTTSKPETKVSAPAKTAELTLDQKRELSLAKIANTRKVDGFYPETLLTKVSRDNTDGDEVILLPAQVRRLWFRLWCEQSGVEGRIDVTVKEVGTNMFRCNAVVYINGVQVSEGEAFKMLIDPKYSPRETAQTQAINLALRNAGFEVYGEKMPEVVSSDDPISEPKKPGLNVVVDDDGVVEEGDTPDAPAEGEDPATDEKDSAPAEFKFPLVNSKEEINDELVIRAKEVHWNRGGKLAQFNGLLYSAMLESEEGVRALRWASGKATDDDEGWKAARILTIAYDL